MKKLLVVITILSVIITMTEAADFNGDGTADIGIFRPSSGLWAIRGVTRVYFGSSGDDPMPGDYNGNNIADIAIFRATTGLWAIRDVTRVYFGESNDLPLGGGSSGKQQVLKTGQTTSYRTGDDGYHQKGKSVLVDNGDGTVTDIRTGLMWPKDGNGAGYASGDSKNWNDAIDWANDLNFAGYTDWRLPNVNEFKSFQEVTWGHYQNQPQLQYWTSTTLACCPTAAIVWNIQGDFLDSTFGTAKTDSYNVVACRGGE